MDKGDVARMFKSANNILGALMFYPSAQINKTVGAIEKASSGEETSLLEFVFGPTYKKSQ
jgi:hypothetical protein